MFVVVHLAPESPSILPDILNRSTEMPVMTPRDGSPIRRSIVAVAPPDLHVVLTGDNVNLSRGPRENRHRPSIDVLFRSAAVAFGPRVTGVILSGMLDDGAAGLWAIKQRGGVAVVQDPDDAEFPDMPRAALEFVDVDHRVTIADMAPLLVRLAADAVSQPAGDAPEGMTREVRMASENETNHMEEMDGLGQRVPLTCPECGGTLWEMSNGGPRYRCYNGHAYSLASLASEQTVQVEAALWAALRRLEEGERLERHMEKFARSRGNDKSATYHADMARSNAAHADTLRDLLNDKSRVRSDVALPSGVAANE